jgi:pre-60S factor REI1
MSSAHSFFLPDADYLVDLPGLLTFLGAKISDEHHCIYCDGEYRSVGSVRSHMIDKGHCKIAYDDGPEWVEIWDYYDFAVAVDPEREARRERRAARRTARAEALERGGGGAEDALEPPASEDESTDSLGESDASGDEDEFPGAEATVDSERRELVLPSGARLGHRADRRFFAQSFPGSRGGGGKPEDPNSGRALVRRLLADKNSALVPRRGGLGAFGRGTDVVRARNAGEAREAGRHVREHRDQRKREDFRTRVGFGHNHQKHFRDPILGKIGS